MISSLSKTISNFTSMFPFKASLIFIIILLVFLISKVFWFKIDIRHKIHNFMFNWVSSIIYIFYYILLMLYFRYIAWGTILDLKLYTNKYRNFLMEKTLIFMISVLLLILLLCLLIKVRAFLLKEIRKRYIYQEFSGLYNSMKQSILKCKSTGKTYEGIYNRPYFNRLTDDLSYLYSYRRFLLNLFRFFDFVCKFMHVPIAQNLMRTKFLIGFIKYLGRGLISPAAEFNFSPEWETVYENISQWTRLFAAQRKYIRNVDTPEYKNRYVYENFEESIEIAEETFLAFKNSKED